MGSLSLAEEPLRLVRKSPAYSLWPCQVLEISLEFCSLHVYSTGGCKQSLKFLGYGDLTKSELQDTAWPFHFSLINECLPSYASLLARECYFATAFFPSRIFEEYEKNSVYLRMLLINSKLSCKKWALKIFRAELKYHFHFISFEALGKMILNLQTLIFPSLIKNK